MHRLSVDEELYKCTTYYFKIHFSPKTPKPPLDKVILLLVFRRLSLSSWVQEELYKYIQQMILTFTFFSRQKLLLDKVILFLVFQTSPSSWVHQLWLITFPLLRHTYTHLLTRQIQKNTKTKTKTNTPTEETKTKLWIETPTRLVTRNIGIEYKWKDKGREGTPTQTCFILVRSTT